MHCAAVGHSEDFLGDITGLAENSSCRQRIAGPFKINHRINRDIGRESRGACLSGDALGIRQPVRANPANAACRDRQMYCADERTAAGSLHVGDQLFG